MNRKLTIDLSTADPRGRRRVAYWLDQADAELNFEEEENGVLMLAQQDGTWFQRYNPHAWQNYVLEDLDG